MPNTLEPRLGKALAYIDAHLDADLSLEQLSRVAACSRFHFHRLFRARFGISLHRYVQLCRLRARAGERLAFRRCPVLDIALDSGYRSPEAFARAFRQTVGQSPSAFRQRPRLAALAQPSANPAPTEEPRHAVRPCPFVVDIVDFPATPIALLEHRGHPARQGDSLRDFIAWRRQQQLPPSVNATYNLLYTDPTTARRTRFASAVRGHRSRHRRQPQGVRAALIRPDAAPGCAIWAPTPNWAPRRAGCTPSGARQRRTAARLSAILQRLRFYPDVAEADAVSELFLPCGIAPPTLDARARRRPERNIGRDPIRSRPIFSPLIY